MSESSGDLGSSVITESRADGERSWIRWSGMAFVLLLVVGWILTSFTWDDPAKDQEILDWYESSGNRIRQLVGAYLLSFAALAFVVFSTGVNQRVSRTGIAPLARGFSHLFAAMLVAGGITISSASASIEIPGYPEFENAELLRLVESVGFGIILLGGLMAAGAAVLATSFGLRGTGAIPSWLVVAGYVVGVLLLFGGVLYIPVVLLPLWVLATSLTVRK